jgi:hypothetical protein
VAGAFGSRRPACELQGKAAPVDRGGGGEEAPAEAQAGRQGSDHGDPGPAPLSRRVSPRRPPPLAQTVMVGRVRRALDAPAGRHRERISCDIPFQSWSRTSSACSSRVAGLFSGRGYNIESLTVAETLDPRSRESPWSTRGDDQVLEQIDQAAQQADQRHQGHRFSRPAPRRARDGAHQGLVRREDPHRRHQHRRHLPRQGHRRRPRLVHHRGHRDEDKIQRDSSNSCSPSASRRSSAPARSPCTAGCGVLNDRPGDPDRGEGA